MLLLFCTKYRQVDFPIFPPLPVNRDTIRINWSVKKCFPNRKEMKRKSIDSIVCSFFQDADIWNMWVWMIRNKKPAQHTHINHNYIYFHLNICDVSHLFLFFSMMAHRHFIPMFYVWMGIEKSANLTQINE